MLRNELHLIEDDLRNYPGEGLWFAWLSWDVFDHWRFVWEPALDLEPVSNGS